jgi:hypothetical protein
MYAFLIVLAILIIEIGLMVLLIKLNGGFDKNLEDKSEAVDIFIV